MKPVAAALLAAALALPAAAAPAAQVSGELKVWHCVTLTFRGPETAETADPNPFRDCRLTVTFTQGERRLAVPGFYAADGNAAETGADRGGAWRARFMPDAPGAWRYVASFRTGKDVALADDPAAGEPAAFDGAAGSFEVAPTDKQGRDHRARGLLRHDGGRYLRFAGTGDLYLKGGADSPENFLAFADFDQTVGGRGKARQGEAEPFLHRYEPHLRDWRPGDPAWRGGRGKGIIGALNYLAAAGMNSVYFLTMNVNGDGKDVWPWTAPDIRDRFDCSKLDQWEIVFSHMDRVGLLLHVVTQETENDQLLDRGELGPERRLYYRELVARFAHHPALVWNLGEENTNTDAQRKAFCDAFHALDPYDHPVVVHTFPGKYDSVYTPLLGHPTFAGPSLQMGNMRQTHAETVKWVRRSAEAGRPWFVCLDEIGPAQDGVVTDAEDPGHDAVRIHALWGNLMGGGSGCEWYFGYKHPHNDLNCEDFRSREAMWAQTRVALEFFLRHVPLAETVPADDHVSRGWCLAKPGEVYAVYLPEGGTAEVGLGAGTYDVAWYDPRTGGALQAGTVRRVKGPGPAAIGSPPRDADRDWAARVTRTEGSGEGAAPVRRGEKAPAPPPPAR